MKTWLFLMQSSVFANSTLDTLPVITNKGTPTMSESSCFKCIRGGWIWCSAKWNYEESTAGSFSALERGKCCYSKSNKATQEADNTNTGSANVTNCPARFSNAVGSAIVERTASDFWCSDLFAVEEYALITCRQRSNFCGQTVVPTFGSITAASA